MESVFNSNKNKYEMPLMLFGYKLERALPNMTSSETELRTVQLPK